MLKVVGYERTDFYKMVRQAIIYCLILRLIFALTHFRPFLPLENTICTNYKVQDSNDLLNICGTDG